MPAKVKDTLEICDISFIADPSIPLPAKVTGERNLNVIAALFCSVLIHVWGAWFFLHLPQETPSKPLIRPIEVSIVTSIPEKTITPLARPTMKMAAAPIKASPHRMPSPVPVATSRPMPATSAVTTPPELKKTVEQTAHPLQSLPAASFRETTPVPVASQPPAMPAAQRSRAQAGAATPLGVMHPSKGGSEVQPVTGPSFGAAYLSNPAPKYPAVARRLKQQGTVTVRVLVSPEGLPKNVTLEKTSGSRILDEAAMETVQHYTFVPARRGSKAIAAEVDVPVRFRLD